MTWVQSCSSESLFKTGATSFLCYTSVGYPCFSLAVLRQAFPVCSTDSSVQILAFLVYTVWYIRRAEGIPSFLAPMSTPGSGRSSDPALHSKLNFPPLCLGEVFRIVILVRSSFIIEVEFILKRKLLEGQKGQGCPLRNILWNLERPALELVKNISGVQWISSQGSKVEKQICVVSSQIFSVYLEVNIQDN